MGESQFATMHECEPASSSGFQVLAACEQGLSTGVSFAIGFGVLAALAVGGLFLWRWLQTRDMRDP